MATFINSKCVNSAACIACSAHACKVMHQIQNTVETKYKSGSFAMHQAILHYAISNCFHIATHFPLDW